MGITYEVCARHAHGIGRIAFPRGTGLLINAAFLAITLFAVCGYCFAAERPENKVVLDNGMTVLVQDNPGDLAAVCVYVKVGSGEEDADTNGITNLLNRTVLACQPAGKSSPPALKIEQLGGSVDVETRSDYSCFSLVTPAKDLDAALKVLADALQKPDCSDAALNTEKNGLMALEDWRYDHLVDRAYRLFLQKTYDGRPYGLAPEGDAGVIARLGHKELTGWHNEHYRPEDMLVSVCGKIDKDAVVRMVSEAFREQVRGKKAQGVWQGEPGVAVASTRRYEEAAPPGRAVAILGYTAPAIGTQDYPAMRLMAAALSDGMGSLVFKALREDDDLAYSFGSIMPPQRSVSRYAIYVMADEDKLDAAVKGILRAVERVKSGDISDDMLTRARGRYIGALMLEQETALDKARQAGLVEFMGLGQGYFDDVVRRLDTMDKGELGRTAMKYMDKYTLVVLRPKDKRR